ncbi:MAG TPA: NADH-ubiquinone oxidoreductase-F iron-sulfur binding region domain-containing protein [Actinomycetota bacterium]|nr:NADH-ubiquinone oxidoreductase-F iron-sulfur binding region domain-containing protein [Actinomycetota bacterium]
MQAEPSAEERAAVDELLGPPESAWDGAVERTSFDHRVARGGQDARENRHLLLPALHALQGAVGWISPGGMNYVCERLTVPPAEAYGVATFYAMFSTEERPAQVLHVCDDIACRLAGGADLASRMAASPMHTVASPCLGLCEHAPAALMQTAGESADVGFGPVNDEMERVFVEGGPVSIGLRGTSVKQRTEGLRLLRRVGHVDPSSIDDYRTHGGYEALRLALEHGPEWTLREVTDSKLMGRGGAAFPTGVKWKAVAEQPVHPHYFVCNADESEPGTFKDRVVMEQDPFAVIESLTIAGITTGCEQGYVYIRGEYPLATRTLTHAIEEARRHGFLGDDVMGHGARFDIELRRGAGAYICGEETALFNSLEGKRGEPRNKPPFPVQRGLFGMPTGINNVETLINVLEVLRIGGEAYGQIGTEGSTGPRLFCLSGDVERPGLYEHEHGVMLGQVIEAAGGVRDGKPLKAVLLGGAAGGFVGPDALDARLTFEDARAGGYTLGSGVVMLFDEGSDLTDTCLRIARFFRDESCGQCVPCRVGTVRQEEALRRIVQGRTLGSHDDELALLTDVAQVMRDASICGLGQTAANAVQSAIESLGVFGGDGTVGGNGDDLPTPTEDQES